MATGPVIRLLGNSKYHSTRLTDARGMAPFIYRGNDLRLQVGLSTHDKYLVKADITTITLSIKALSAIESTASLLEKQYFSTDCSDTFSGEADWLSGDDQLLELLVDRDEVSFDVGTYRMILIHENSNGERLTHAVTEFEVKEDYWENPSLTTPPAPSIEYYNKTEIDGLLGNVDNTADADKPVSSATQTAIDTERRLRPLPPVTGLQESPSALTLPWLASERTLISTNDGAMDYNSWPVARFDAKNDQLVAVWTRSLSHAGENAGELMFARSTDGTKGKAFTAPAAIILPVGTEAIRDGSIEVFDDRLRVTVAVFASWTQNALGYTRHYDSFDNGETWALVGQINASLTETASLGQFTRAVAMSRIITAPNGELLQAGFESNTQFQATSGGTFHRSVLWSSLDNGATWTLKSVILPTVFSDDTDATTATQEPNETEIFPYAGKIVALVRDNPSVGTSKLWRLETGDFGTTWSAAVDVTPNEYTANKPLVTVLPDGRLLLPTRLDRTDFTSMSIYNVSEDGGSTWLDERLITENGQDEYQSAVVVSDERLVVFAGNDDVYFQSSSIWTYELIFKNPSTVDFPQIANLATSFDADTLVNDGSAANGFPFTDWAATSGREPTPTYVEGYLGKRSIIIDDGQEALTTGAAADHKFLSDGSAFTVGLLMRNAVRDANTQILGTCRSTSSQTGLTIYTAPTGRTNFSVNTNGTVAINYTSPPNTFNDRPWELFFLVFDGSEFSVYHHGRLIEDGITATGSFSASNPTWPLFIGHDPGGALTKNETIVRSAAIWNVALTGDEVKQAGIRLSK